MSTEDLVEEFKAQNICKRRTYDHFGELVGKAFLRGKKLGMQLGKSGGTLTELPPDKPLTIDLE